MVDHKRHPILLGLFILALIICYGLISSREGREEPMSLKGPAPGPPMSIAERLQEKAESDSHEGHTRAPNETPIPDVGSEIPVDSQSPIEGAQEKLASLIDSSLDGVLNINQVLDQALIFARLPVSNKVDFDYEDKDEIAYKILGLPEATDAHFKVGMQSYERSGKEINYLQMEIQLEAGVTSLNRGALREGPRIVLAIDYDEDGNAGYMSVTTERRVALQASSREGINAYEGMYTSGAVFKANMNEPSSATSQTFGIIDGKYGRDPGADGISPLLGAHDIAPSKVDELLGVFLTNFNSIKGL